MHIKKVCLCCSKNYNLFPAIVLTPKGKGFIVAFKFLRGHFGLWVSWEEREKINIWDFN